MIDFLISPCGQLVTIAGNNVEPRRGSGLGGVGLVTGGAVGINLQTGTIEYAGPVSDLDQRLLLESCPVLDASNSVVLPGFVDSHTHLVFSGNRVDEFYRRAQGQNYQDIARSGGGIQKTVNQTRTSTIEELESMARKRLHRLYDNGTTTVEIKSGYGLDFESEMNSLKAIRNLHDSEPGLILSTFLGAHLIPAEYADDRAAYVKAVIEMLYHVDQHGLADFYDIFVDTLAFSLDEAKEIVASGSQTSLGLKLHADEFGDDGTTAWGVSVDALSVDHLGGIGSAGIKALASSDTVATLLPATMLFSGHGKYAPARDMLKAGCAIALATDLNPGSSLVYSMPFTMSLAALKMGMSAEECIVAGTINGAHALGIGNLVGSLEPGKHADILIADVQDYREIPYHVGCDLIRDVFIRGRAVKRLGNLALAT